MKYHRNIKKDKLQSKRFAENKRTRLIWKSVFGVLIFSVFLFVLSMLSSLSFMQIKTIEMLGASPEVASSSRVLAQNELQGKSLGIFSRSNVFLYPKSKIIDEIQSTFPGVESVSIKRNGFSSLQINIIPKTALSVVCSSLPDNFEVSSNDHCFFADKNGYIFGPTDNHVESLPRIFIQDSTTTDMTGFTPMVVDRYTGFLNFYKKLVEHRINVFGLLVSEANNNELYIGNNPENFAVVYFNEKNGLDEVYVNLSSFLDHMNLDGKTHSFSEIKLQFPPNVYYTESK